MPKRLKTTSDSSPRKKRLKAAESRQIRDKHVSDGTNSDTFHPELLSLLMTSTWNLYRLTPMYNLSCKEYKLKSYASKIKQALVNESKGAGKDIQFDTKITLIPEEIDEARDSFFSLQIEVFVIKNEESPKLKYKGILLRCNPTETYTNYYDNLTQMPLLLCKGPLFTTRIVHQTLSNTFDSRFQQLTFSEDNLIVITAMAAETISRKDKAAIFDFSQIKSIYSLSLAGHIIKTLWEKIKPDNSDKITKQQSFLYKQQIYGRFEDLFQININKFKLFRVRLPDCMLSSDGKIKIYKEETAQRIFEFITHFAILSNTPIPEMSSDFNSN